MCNVHSEYKGWAIPKSSILIFDTSKSILDTDTRPTVGKTEKIKSFFQNIWFYQMYLRGK